MGLAVLTLLIRWIVGFFPDFVERFYARGLFQGIRWVFDHTLTITPIPLFYVLFLMLVVWLIFAVRRSIKSKHNWSARLLRLGRSVLTFAGGFITLFMWLWGFNYARIPIEQQLNIQPKPLSNSELRHIFKERTQQLSALRANIVNADTHAISEDFLPSHLENKMRILLVKTLNELGYPTVGRVRGRLIFPKGTLLRNSASGIYIPFIGEGNIDGGLHHLSLPFTMAHEMAHGYGFGDEGTCNFLAYLACQRAEDPYIRYAGAYSYWRYLRSAVRRMDAAVYENIAADFPIGVRNDLEDLKRSWTKYRPSFSALRDTLYDIFLKSQGVQEGVKSYSKVVQLVEGYE